jgi:hypothetical protein
MVAWFLMCPTCLSSVVQSIPPPMEFANGVDPHGSCAWPKSRLLSCRLRVAPSEAYAMGARCLFVSESVGVVGGDSKTRVGWARFWAGWAVCATAQHAVFRDWPDQLPMKFEKGGRPPWVMRLAEIALCPLPSSSRPTGRAQGAAHGESARLAREPGGDSTTQASWARFWAGWAVSAGAEAGSVSMRISLGMGSLECTQRSWGSRRAGSSVAA